jgi:hypothetical protein
MKILKTILLTTGLLISCSYIVSAADSPTFLTQKGKALFSDDFTRMELGKNWNVHPDSFVIKEGVLIASQRPTADHGAVSETLVDFKDAVIEFSFKFDGATSFNVVIDDKKYKGSHAGHICRVVINPKSITVGDDKEGIMKNGIFEARRDPKQKAEADKLTKGKASTGPVALERGRWYTVTIEILGDEMLASLDGKPLVYLQSPGIAHTTKTDFGFTINGRSLELDNVHAWAAEPNPAWAKHKQTLLAK